MPFTSSIGRMGVTLMPLARLRAVVPRQLLLARVRLGRGVDQRTNHLLVGFIPFGRVAPLLAVPRMHAATVHAAVVAAGGPERLDHVAESERLHLRCIEVQLLGAPAHFLAVHGTLAVLGLSRLDSLHRQHRGYLAAVVTYASDIA